MKLAVLSMAVIAALTLATGPAAATDVAPVTAGVARTAQTLKPLKNGGHVIVVLPGAADPKEDSLSDIGRLNASGIGKLLAAETIPVGQVYAGTDSRGAETAERIIAAARPDASIEKLAPGAAGVQRLRALAGAAPLAATNTVVVASKADVQAAFGQQAAGVSDAELLVFKPSHTKAFALVARIKLKELSAYTAAQKAPAPKQG
jgi:hypothetical protein